MDWDWSFVQKFTPMYVEAAVLTVTIGVIGILLSIVIGLVCALVKYYKVPVARQIVAVYIELSRNTPLIVQLFFLYFGLPKAGVLLSSEACGVIGLAFLGGSYMAESFLGGLRSVGKIQLESAESLGLRRWQVMRYIILPQAMKTTLPAMGNEFVSIIKESSLLYAVGLYELTYQAQKLAATNYLYLETMTVAALVYFVLTFTASRLLGLLERRLRQSEQH